MKGRMMTKITQSALASPPMSWLRKMSMKMKMRSQIHRMKMKNSSIVQKMPSIG